MEESERQCSRKSARNEVTLRTGVPTNHIAPLSSPLIYRIHTYLLEHILYLRQKLCRAEHGLALVTFICASALAQWDIL
jgi:hypothetical protein